MSTFSLNNVIKMQNYDYLPGSHDYAYSIANVSDEAKTSMKRHTPVSRCGYNTAHYSPPSSRELYESHTERQVYEIAVAVASTD